MSDQLTFSSSEKDEIANIQLQLANQLSNNLTTTITNNSLKQTTQQLIYSQNQIQNNGQISSPNIQLTPSQQLFSFLPLLQQQYSNNINSSFNFEEQRKKLFELQYQQQQFILEQQKQQQNNFLNNSSLQSINFPQNSSNFLTQLPPTLFFPSFLQQQQFTSEITKNLVNSNNSPIFSLISNNNLLIKQEEEEKIKNNSESTKQKLKEVLIEKVIKGKEEENIKEGEEKEEKKLSKQQKHQQLLIKPSSSSLIDNNEDKYLNNNIPIFQITPQQLHLAMQQYFKNNQIKKEEENKKEGKEEIIFIKEENNLEKQHLEIIEEDEDDSNCGDYIDVVGDGEARSSLPKMQRKAHIEFYRKLKSFRNRGPQLDCQLCSCSIPNNDTSIRSHVHGHCKTLMFICKLCQKGFQDQHLVFEHIDREHPTHKGTKLIEDRRDMGLLMEVLNQCFPRVICKARDILFEAIGRIIALTESKKQTKINCLLCGEIVPTIKSCIYGHLSIHPSYKCKKCRYSCNDERNQLEHQKREHPDFPLEERCYCISLAFDVLLETLKNCFSINDNQNNDEQQNTSINNNNSSDNSLFLHPGTILKLKKINKNEDEKEIENKNKKKIKRKNEEKKNENECLKKKKRQKKKSGITTTTLSEEQISDQKK